MVRPKIYVNNIELKDYPLTCNELCYKHPGLRFAGVLQYPLDFGNMRVGYACTVDKPYKVIATGGPSTGNWVLVDVLNTPYQILFVHVYDKKSVGYKGRAKDTICRIAPKSANGGYSVHLHIASFKIKSGKREAFKVRSLVYSESINPEKDPCESYKIQVSKYKHQVEILESKIVNRENDIEQLQEDLEKCESKYNDIHMKLEVEQREYLDTASELGDIREELERSTELLGECRSNYRNLQNAHTKMKADLKNCEKDLKSCREADYSFSELLSMLIDRLGNIFKSDGEQKSDL